MTYLMRHPGKRHVLLGKLEIHRRRDFPNQGSNPLVKLSTLRRINEKRSGSSYWNMSPQKKLEEEYRPEADQGKLDMCCHVPDPR